MDAGLPKSLFLVILILAPLIPPSDFLLDTNRTPSENFASLPEDSLLHTLAKARQKVPNYDPVFLQFPDTHAVDHAVKVLEYLKIPILHRYRLLPLVLVGELTPEKLVTLAKSCSITNIHPNKIHKLIEPPEELISPPSGNDWNSSRLPTIIGTKQLLEEGHDGTGIIIAILDTGVDGTHPDLVDKIIHEASFVNTQYGYLDNETVEDTFGHGTAVAGAAVGTGKASNGLYAGVAPGAKLWNVKVLNLFGGGREAGIVAGIEYATFGPDNQRDPSDPDIINLSLGGPGGPEDLSSLAVDAAVAEGVVVTASAGNEGPFFLSIGSPGAAINAITVGATKLNGTLSEFSSRGFNLGRYPDPDIVAPGQDIIAPLSDESFLGLAKTTLYPPEYISGTGGNYVSLSGTSFSSPIVAGSCALLLEAFPQLKEFGPIALRIVLMHTANRTHPSFQDNPNLGGAGALDVVNAATFLENLGDASERDLILVFPNLLLAEPAFVAFPGNKFEQTILLLSISPGTFTFAVEGPIEPFIELGKASLHLEKGDVVPINFTVSLPLDIIPTHNEPINGSLNVRMNGELVVQIPFQPIDIRYPKLRVYFDNFHNQEPGDSPLGNFFTITKLLRNKSIDVVVHNSFISYEALSTFDILLLPDIELMFAREEIQAIHQFLEAGGNLIVLGAEKESIAVETVNELLDPFGIALNDTIELVTDQGVRKHHEENLNVTDFSSHPLIQDVASLTWKTGIGLTVDTKSSYTRELATITLEEVEHTVLAIYESTQPHRGNVIVLGTDYLFYDDFLNETESNNRQLAENLFEWLTPDRELLPYMMINRTRVAPGDIINIITYALISGTYKPTTVTDLTLTVVLPNGTETLLTNEYAKPPFEIIPGIYRYNYTLPMDLHGHYTFKAHSSRFEESISTIVYVFETEPNVISTEVVVQTRGRDIVEPAWSIYFDEPKLDRYDDKITFEATIHHADHVTLHLTLLGDELSELSKQPTANYAFPMRANPNHQQWSYEWYPNSTIPAGMYAFFVFPTTAEGTFPLNSTNSTGTFILLDSEPVVDETNTFINDRSIKELDDLLDSQRIMTLPGLTVPIEMAGEDLEDPTNELEAWVVVVELSLFVIDEYVLAASTIPYNTQTGKFKGDFTLPSDILITPHGQLPEDVVLAFILILRDSDGDFGETLALITMRTSLLPFGLSNEALATFGVILMASLFLIHPMLGTFVVLVATTLIAWLLLQRSSRSSKYR